MKFGYARVSTLEQNLHLQVDEIQKFGVDHIYEEKITSRAKHRPQLEELLKMLRAGDTLVIWRLDRLGRTVNELISLAEDFEKRGVHFVSLRENLDTTTAMGKFCFHIFCAAAQMERDVISERTKAGLAAARKRGRSGGRPKANQGNITRALKMYHTKEFTIEEIRQATGISKATLYNYLKKEGIPNGKQSE